MHLGSRPPSDRRPDRVRTRRRRTIAVAAGALTLLVAGTPLLPDSDGPTPSVTPAGESSPPVRGGGTAAPGAITPEMRAEIERVVAEGARTPVSARSSAYRLATTSTRCAMFEGQRYCLGLGWTMKTQQEAAAGLAAAAAPTPTRTVPEQTGDLDPMAAMRQRAELSTKARARAERAELTAAARAVAKVWLIRHEIQGVPLPADFLEHHPEAAVAARTKPRRHPRTFKILREKQVRPQNETYYCGPTTVQMIAWGWRIAARARRCGPTGCTPPPPGPGSPTWSASSTTTPARAARTRRGLHRARHQRLHLQAVVAADEEAPHTYQAPVVLHPVLLKQYFPYLDDDASGHFQVGRGFEQTQDGRSSSATSSPGTRASSTRPSRGSRAPSGSRPTRASAPTRPTSSTTWACDAAGSPYGDRREPAPAGGRLRCGRRADGTTRPPRNPRPEPTETRPRAHGRRTSRLAAHRPLRRRAGDPRRGVDAVATGTDVPFESGRRRRPRLRTGHRGPTVNAVLLEGDPAMVSLPWATRPRPRRPGST